MSSRFWTGFIIIILGIGFLLQQINVWNFGNIVYTSWPFIIVIAGIIQLFHRTKSSAITGSFLVIIGGLFYINKFVEVNLINLIWPLAIISIGMIVLFSKSNGKYKHNSDHSVQSLALFAEVDIRNESKDFNGGEIKAIFGSAKFDLRDIILSKNEVTLDLLTIFGDIKLTVPDHIRVEVSGSPIFGECKDQTRKKLSGESPLPVLKINHLTIFGSVYIRD